jgi:hypothetical protein
MGKKITEKPLKQLDLSIDDQKLARDIYWLMEALMKFQNICTPKLFKWLYGDQQGQHLWETFVIKCNRDIMVFLNTCSSDVKVTLVCNLVYDYRRGDTNLNIIVHC